MGLFRSSMVRQSLLSRTCSGIGSFGVGFDVGVLACHVGLVAALWVLDVGCLVVVGVFVLARLVVVLCQRVHRMNCGIQWESVVVSELVVLILVVLWLVVTVLVMEDDLVAVVTLGSILSGCALP